ncbi:hypothetical protein MKK75_10965 [Methylobacterium sp. J-030]|uniref:hypothetical protein n=1 Tax=Methylobacterium sp. J-030 TaxID=2836627 RepID=UPI001FB9472C|nr:hypothetical protein [Methylobacterium sp. J-030]MCJ2069314.1 hypothetical protein [Methylobacterium sp. J-030]
MNDPSRTSKPVRGDRTPSEPPALRRASYRGDAHDAWVGWAVDVYDPLGRRRMTLPFADVPREGR